MKLPFREIPSLSYGESQYHTLIEGDNLDILARLPLSSVDLIYTDPPYGTGQRFRYDDRLKRGAWMKFMTPRLSLMRRLLKPSGVLAISIGKEELFYLGAFLDGLFGEENQLGIINWQKTYAPKNDTKHIADATDYVLVYAKDRQTTRSLCMPHDQPSTLWGLADPCLDPNRIRVGDIPLLPFQPSWYHQHFDLGCQSWPYQQSGHNQGATRMLNDIMGGGHAYATPKPLKLIEKIVQLWCPPDGIILDPFAGSGTTGHAVLDLNAHLGGRRRFILIEQGNPPTGDAFARTLTAERLRRVLTGEWATGEHPPLPGGFVFQCLTASSGKSEKHSKEIQRTYPDIQVIRIGEEWKR